ncbi:hypothetical protein [Aquabacterium sp.]|uniref:hypothetical protein n=1 Tax=Aquabacterium sp. TaxID=1872578 RepID=UPI003D6C8584
MSDDKLNSSDEQKQEITEASANEASSETSNDVQRLEAELAKLTDNLDKARKGEKFHKQSKEELVKRVQELEAAGDFKTKYEELVNKQNGNAIKAEVTRLLSDPESLMKAKDLNAVLALVNQAEIKVTDGVVDAESAKAALIKAKEKFGGLFEVIDTPTPARGAEKQPTGGYEKELSACKSESEILAVLLKHGKLKQ